MRGLLFHKFVLQEHVLILQFLDDDFRVARDTIVDDLLGALQHELLGGHVTLHGLYQVIGHQAVNRVLHAFN